MSNANRDYAIVYDVKNSSLVLSRPLNFYITDKNTSNIFVRLVTKVNIGNGVDQYTDIEKASNYVLTMRVIKPNNEVKSIEATQHEPESIFQFDLTEDFKDIPGKYICELTISTIVSSRQELITSDPFSYEVKRSILSNAGEIIETEDTTVEKLLNDLDATKAELSSQIKEKANYTFVDVRQYGAIGDGTTDDTQAIQNAIDYASTLTDNTTGGNIITVKIPFGNYKISTLQLKRNIKLCGGGSLIVTGSTGIVMDGCLYNVLEGINIKLTEENQTAIALQLDKNTTKVYSQLNIFNNVIIEGNNLKDTVGIKIGYSWVNTFNECKIFRCADGVWFNDFDSNDNIFYNCEIRHNMSHENSKVAVLHRDGKNNSFIGGAIENYNAAIDLRKGDLKLQNVYTEAFYADTPFIIRGGTLTFNGCLLKGKFKILGGEMLRIINCDAYHSGYDTNINSPLIQFFDDVDTEIVMSNNKFPDNVVFTREGYYKNGSTWIKKEKWTCHQSL